MVSKGGPMGLISKGNIQKRSRGQKHKLSPLFPSNTPINPCPEVSMRSKINTQLPNDKTYLQVWEAHLQTYDHDRWVRDHMVGSVGREMAERTSWWLQGVVVCCLRTILEKKILLGISPTKWWVTNPMEECGPMWER